MMKKVAIWTVLICLALAIPGFGAKAAPEKDQVTQGELARILVNVLGLARFLPASPTVYECAEMLSENSIMPKDGWDVEKIVNKADLARVIVLAMKRGGEVKDPDKDKSWISYLAGLGVNINSIGQATDELKPLAEPVAAHVFKGNSNTDPLKDVKEFGEPDETEYGADANVRINSAILQQIIQEVEFAPVAPTRRPLTPN